MEQRRREISIHRVIGGTESGLTSMILRELAVVGVIGWFTGYLLAMASVPVVLDAVGFMAFERSDFRVVPTLSGLVAAYIYGNRGAYPVVRKLQDQRFLSIEIDDSKSLHKKEIKALATSDNFLRWNPLIPRVG